jgi:starch phosphorylase
LTPTATTRSAPLDIRTGLDPEAIARAIVDNLRYLQGKLPRYATRNDWYLAVAHAIRDRLLARSLMTVEAVADDVDTARKIVAYLSAEFLIGPQLGNSLVNLGITGAVHEALVTLGQDLAALLEQEEEPGLGNGGLGRLAACYMDSLATLQVPAIGYGIRYEFGIFDQAIRDGWQVEITDKWLRHGNPWEIVRGDVTFDVSFGGRTQWFADEQGWPRVRWIADKAIKGRVWPATRRCRDTASPAPICCACGRRRQSSRSTSPRSTPATITAPSTRRSSRKRFRRCSTRTTSPTRERRCGWRSSTSSSPARCRT